MKITKLNIEELSIGVLFFDNYNTPYIESTYKELNVVIQAFRSMLDEIDKVEELIVASKRLKEGDLDEKCIGENETIISYEEDYFQFYSISLSEEIYLELERTGQKKLYC